MLALPFFKKTKKTPDKFLAVDIGSNDVKVIAFELQQNPEDPLDVKAAVVGIGKQKLLEDSTRGGVIVDMEDVEQAILTAINHAVNGDIKNYSNVVFGVSGNLCVGLMTTVKVTRGRKDEVTEREWSDVLDRVQEAAYDQVQTRITEITGNSDMEVQLITTSTVYTKLDDKEVDDVVGQPGQKIETAVFTAFTPSYHLDALSELASRLNLNIMAISSQMYSLARSIAMSKGGTFDGAILDIGGEVTDVSVVFGGGIVATRTLDIGGHHFTLELSKNMNLSLADAEHKKLEYSYGRLADSDVILLQGYMDNLLDTWLSGVELLFSDFTGVKTFAPKIYMIGGGSGLADITEILTKEPWSKSIPFKSPPEFEKLTIDDLTKVVDRTGKINSLTDLVPASLSVVYLEAVGLL